MTRGKRPNMKGCPRCGGPITARSMIPYCEHCGQPVGYWSHLQAYAGSRQSRHGSEAIPARNRDGTLVASDPPLLDRGPVR